MRSQCGLDKVRKVVRGGQEGGQEGGQQGGRQGGQRRSRKRSARRSGRRSDTVKRETLSIPNKKVAHGRIVFFFLFSLPGTHLHPHTLFYFLFPFFPSLFPFHCHSYTHYLSLCLFSPSLSLSLLSSLSSLFLFCLTFWHPSTHTLIFCTQSSLQSAKHEQWLFQQRLRHARGLGRELLRAALFCNWVAVTGS